MRKPRGAGGLQGPRHRKERLCGRCLRLWAGPRVRYGSDKGSGDRGRQGAGLRALRSHGRGVLNRALREGVDVEWIAGILLPIGAYRRRWLLRQDLRERRFDPHQGQWLRPRMPNISLRTGFRRRRWNNRQPLASMALMMPATPSETTGKGSPRPRRRLSWKKALTVGPVQNFVCEPTSVIYAASTNRSPNWMANWSLAACHSFGGFRHFAVMFLSAS